MSNTVAAIGENKKPAQVGAAEAWSADAIWRAARPVMNGTPAASYLARAVGRHDLTGFAALRWHQALPDRETGTPRPAVIGRLDGYWADHTATLILWLARDAAGTWCRAPLLRPQHVVGAPSGSCLRLWRTDAWPPLPRALAGARRVVVSRSLQLGLRIAGADRAARVLCTVSADNLAALRLPESVRAVDLARHDREAPAILDALAACAARLRAEGRCVTMIDHRGRPLPLAGAEATGGAPDGADAA